MTTPSEILDDIAHERAIKRRLLDYCRGVDRLELGLVRSAYHADAHDDHGPYKGSVDGLVEWIEERHQHIVQSAHQLTNCIIERNDDRAAVETYFTVIQTERAPDDQGTTSESVFTGRYVDVFERRDAEWRIADRLVLVETRSVRSVERTADDESWMSERSRRDRRDAIWEKRTDVLALDGAGSGR